MSYTASEIASKIQGEVIGDGSTILKGFSTADKAGPGDLTFAENEEFFAKAEESAASAVLVASNVTSTRKVVIRVANARIAFAKVLPLFFPEPAFAPGVHPTAIVAASAVIDPSAHIGPQCLVGENVRIGAGAVLEGLDSVGANCVIGEKTRLFPRVTLYPNSSLGRNVRLHSGVVIGSDGFGYVLDGGVHRKIQQIGTVIVHDDVEIGANSTVDRGALGPTTIGKGTKIDNLVQIGHNSTIGEHCIIISQVGVAGSSKIGNYVILAGQVGLAGHTKVGDRAVVAGQSGVMTDIPEGGRYLGSPAVPDRQAKRQYLAIQQLPDLIRRVRELEQLVNRADKK